MATVIEPSSAAAGTAPADGLRPGHTMSYSDFSVEDVKERFQLSFEEGQDLYGSVPALEVSALLRESLADGLPLALAINTEKARSEMIIAPVLLESRRQMKHQTSLFSGVDFNVAPEQGLRGVCDFLLGRSREQLIIEAPVVAVVEAKNEDINAGIPQCFAQMVAIRLFNQRKGRELPVVFGAVTTGTHWKFVKLRANTAYVDVADYYINELERIMGILVGMLRGTVD